jgi:HD-GYP domain-containing protein (c-di-GMP phosphodiesterase class II)
MQNIHLENLRPGMIVGRSIPGVDNTIILTAGIELTKAYIEQLRQLGVPSVYIQDHRTQDIELRSPVQDYLRLKAARLLKSIFKEISSQLISRIDISDYLPQLHTVAEDILQDILTSDKLVLDFFEIKNVLDYNCLHSVDVCILAVLMGKKLGLEIDKLQELAVGALLHDIGKALVPGSIITKPGALTPEEYQQMKRHTLMGFELLCRTKDVTPGIAQVSLEHHERFDGRGYPNGLKGSQISFYSRLIAICDVYDALTSDRFYRKRYLPHQAAEFIMGGGGTHFDYRLVKTFIDCVAMYPLGSVVHLNTGQMGTVAKVMPNYTTRPILRILQDQEGRNLAEPFDLDLSKHPQTFITHVL